MTPNLPTSTLQPIYVTAVPDERLRLYSGRLQVIQGTTIGEGDGEVELAWSPSTRLLFAIPSVLPPVPLQANGCVLRLSTGAEAQAHLLRVTHSGDQAEQALRLRGRVFRRMVQQSRPQSTSTYFHVVNFRRYLAPRPDPAPPEYDVGRVDLEGGGWRVALQAVPGLKELEDALDENSGRAITHVGKVVRSNGSPFTREEALELFDALHSFLAFARGLWAPPIMYVGFSPAGDRAWEDWAVRIASPWQSALSWFPVFHPQSLADIFPGFMRLWQDPDWREIIQVAIHWYVEANLVSGAIEGSVMMTQNALERLAYYYLVHVRHLLTEADFAARARSAAERLRMLLTEHNVPTALVNSFRIKHLPQLAATRGWPDGPEALVILRNSIMHPDQRNQQRLQNYPLDARHDAWLIGLWYLEMVLLKLFGYAGPYYSRLTCHADWQTELMP